MAYESEFSRSGYDRTITAFFDRREDASGAIENLVAAGIPRDRISMVAGSAGQRTAVESEEGGFWQALGNFFFPEEDRYSYAEGLRRGGHMVTVRTDSAHYDTALDILDDEGAVDMEEREAAWRSEGWRGYEPRTDVDQTGFWRTAQQGSPTAGAGSGQHMQEMHRDEDFSRGGAIPVAEENLRIGKRDVSHGRVRVRSYVVEEPVSEDVSLRSEHVNVERRPVDRPATGADDLFRERSIEAEEYTEEPVVSKEARIREEVTLDKDYDEHTENVSDTVRHTEVDIEDDRDDDWRRKEDYDRK